jgi:tRNA threonylcarbamoyladenosine biosynthesis protein TsaE
MTEFFIKQVDQIGLVAADLLSRYPNQRVFAFRGEMGVGKTTFIKALCTCLGAEDVVNSPSFAIVNEYETTDGKTIYHFDFYRIKQVDEAYDMGYEDYIYSGAYCFLEWPEKIESLLPRNRLELQFVLNDDYTRTIRVGELHA